MVMSRQGLTLAALGLCMTSVLAQPKPTWYYDSLPDKSESGEAGTNRCSGANNAGADCQTLIVNDLSDFCLWGPPASSTIGDDEREVVAYCLKDHGARTLPASAISGAHFVQTPDYIQITGVGDLTQINIQANDGGGELDPHGADGNGNPIGGLVFTNAFSANKSETQAHEWTMFVSSNQFCVRVCKEGGYGTSYCQHVYDVMGCDWNMPANYDAGVLESCVGDSDIPMGIYNNGSSTFSQGQAYTPPAQPAAPSSKCVTVQALAQATPISTVLPPSTSASTSATVTARNTTTIMSTTSLSSVSSTSSLPSSTSLPMIAVTTTTVTSTPPPLATSTTSLTRATPASALEGAAYSQSGSLALAIASIGLVALIS
ncbi:uncharacterized protein L969DRAFT_92670 [Mixia osmundae IAM 14324]|uniref:Uncharacterized protein n=1 Tax=Mixia osmundae (strain CBS 9802 / IAM 14324 / JCM 22182 / KY 12970) TaxID=764103 RepID=G7DY79_MIXOS|nr:uncharacterized protein L969DRAFT_92670 [Mixia osmundae IAM 14324]KEI41442.1 hypothetical protein L969DRAFT_92670 [Mixia osmundae IAM 14324]GAA95539.1 hypothetical protein E5Q_02194 [Mixia osmundae IAM 14324]